jgi:SpoIID/LytB domain protein
MSEQPSVTVGILSAPTINVDFIKPYTVAAETVTGLQTLSVTDDGCISWHGNRYAELLFTPAADDCVFEIKDVVIGVNFHWQRKENQRFGGAARIIVEGDKLTIINVLPVEDYLCSVISSEMSANASLELLKAHAVISRSWLLSQISKKKGIEHGHGERVAHVETESERIRWYDREDHLNFDVCADDHCQRYQGVTRQTSPNVAAAVAATHGQVLTYDGQLCDARFSKCCGGVLEQFENCWEPKRYNYLLALRDCAKPAEFPDLRREDNAKAWIESDPEAFCNTVDARILSQVLNNYDQETPDFYRWTVTYTAAELSALVRERSGIDFGVILDLVPLERGTSGRIVRLQIVGTKRTMVIGKELEIRRTLSKTHLYSSAFTVEHTGDAFVLRGAGWGHGVGLCQIGAAVMGAKGYTYKQILAHYFLNADISTIY